MRQVILQLSLAVLSLGSLWGTHAGEQSSSRIAFNVSPYGSDTNPGTEQQPFRTIERARDAVRSNTEDMAQNIVVYLRGGTYNIDRTIVFDHRDSGKNGHTVVYRNYESESPIISGGQKIGSWRLDSGNRWKAGTTLENFRQLYVNGVRAVRARGGPLSGAELYGGTGTRVRMPAWQPGIIQATWSLSTKFSGSASSAKWIVFKKRIQRRLSRCNSPISRWQG